MRNWKLAVSTFVVIAAGTALAQHGPPPEALSACSGLAESAACAFTHRGQNLTGVCRAGPGGAALACAPAGGPGGPRTPPPEATSACQGKSRGDACSFSHPTPSGETRALTGTCDAPPDAAALACRPQRPDGAGPHHGPPPEAVAACASSSAGASCSVSLRGETLAGTCETAPDGATLACRPAGMRPPR